MRRTLTSLAALACITALLVGCADASDQAERTATKALANLAPPTTAAPTPTTTAPNCDATASLRPTGPLPPPGQMPAGSTMAKILARGRLVVGVDQNTKLLAYRNPRTGDLEGYDVDLLRELARAIFGDPNAIEFRTVTTPQRIPVMTDPSSGIDVVASSVTMTCARWQQVLFSTEYYAAEQRVMVRGDATDINSVADLAGKKVCVTKGSTSIDNLAAQVPKAEVAPVDARIDCLVKLQDGTVDAITTDDTILFGFQDQDGTTTTKLLPGSLEAEPYGMIFHKEQPDFVRFANGVLEQLRANGRLAEIGQTWLHGNATPPPPARYQP